jgi:hypothetical protein
VFNTFGQQSHLQRDLRLPQGPLIPEPRLQSYNHLIENLRLGFGFGTWGRTRCNPAPRLGKVGQFAAALRNLSGWNGQGLLHLGWHILGGVFI